MISFRKIEAHFIWFILIAALTYNTLCFQESILNMVPVPEGMSDEMDYFTDAKSFYLTSSLHTSLSLDESVSKIGECGAHGFVYALFYGTMQKLFHGSELTIVLANLVSLLFALFYLYKQKYNLLIKNSIATLVLSYFITITFLQTYFVEVLNISFALFLSLYLYKLYSYSDEKEKRKKTWLFFLFVLICSTFRFTYIFFLFGLIPMAINKKTLLFYSGMIVFGIVSILIFNIFFTTSTLFHPTKSVIYLILNGGNDNIMNTYNLIVENLRAYFGHNTSLPDYFFYYKYVLIILPVIQVYFYIQSKDKIYLAPIVISALYLLAISPLNNNESDLNDLRPLSAVFIMNIVFLVLQNKRSVQYALILLALLSIPEINKQVQSNGRIRLKYWQYYSRMASEKKYDFIREYNSEKEIITVQLPNKNALFNDLYLMPLISNEGKPIRYNITNFKDAPEKSLFITHYLE